MSTEENQPANMDQAMIERARELGPVWIEQHPDQPKSWHSGSWSDEALVEFAAAFASSIQAEACQDAAIDKEISQHHSALIGKIQAVVDQAFPGERWADYDVLNQGVYRILERAESAEQQLAEARAERDEAQEDALKAIAKAGSARVQGMREAANIARSHPYHCSGARCANEGIAIAIESAVNDGRNEELSAFVLGLLPEEKHECEADWFGNQVLKQIRSNLDKALKGKL